MSQQHNFTIQNHLWPRLSSHQAALMAKSFRTKCATKAIRDSAAIEGHLPAFQKPRAVTLLYFNKMCTRVCMNIHIRIYIYIYIHRHTHTYIYMYTYIVCTRTANQHMRWHYHILSHLDPYVNVIVYNSIYIYCISFYNILYLHQWSLQPPCPNGWPNGSWRLGWPKATPPKCPPTSKASAADVSMGKCGFQWENAAFRSSEITIPSGYVNRKLLKIAIYSGFSH